MRLKDKVAIVTGSARGLGKGIAIKLAEEGAKVVIADMAGAEETAKEISDNGGTATAFQVNVAKQDEVQALVKYAIDTYGTLDIMVNNAGINRDGMLHKMPVENWDTVHRCRSDRNILRHTGSNQVHAPERIRACYQYFLRKLAGKHRAGKLCCRQSRCSRSD